MAKKKENPTPEIVEEEILEVEDITDELLADSGSDEMSDAELAGELPDEDAPVKKDKATLIADLVDLGRNKGKLTAQEIMDAMELFDFDPEQMDKLYEQVDANRSEEHTSELQSR